MKATIDEVTYEGTPDEIRSAVMNHIESIGRRQTPGQYVFPVPHCSDDSELVGGEPARPDYSRLG